MDLKRYPKHPLRKMAVPCIALRKPSGVTLSNAAHSLTVGAGLTLINCALRPEGDGVISLVGGGTAPNVYQVTAECDASNGEHYVWEFEIEVVDL